MRDGNVEDGRGERGNGDHLSRGSKIGFYLAAWSVSTEIDESDGDFSAGDLSLREAVEQANLTSGGDDITFEASMAGKTIALSLGELQVTDSVNITGLGQDQTTIDAQGGSRVFNITRRRRRSRARRPDHHGRSSEFRQRYLQRIARPAARREHRQWQYHGRRGRWDPTTSVR